MPQWVQTVVLEEPAPVLVGLVVLALKFFFSWHRRRSAKSAYVAIIMLFLVTTLWGTATTVVTQRERLTARCQALVAVAVASQVERPVLLENMFVDDTVLRGPDGLEWMRGGPALLRRLDEAVRRFNVQQHKILSLNVQTLDESEVGSTAAGVIEGRTVISVRTTVPAEFSIPPRTKWDIHWRLGPDGQWRMIDIQWRTINGQRPAIGAW